MKNLFYFVLDQEGQYCIFLAFSNSRACLFKESKPSKKEIVGQAILDLGGDTDKDETLYQRYRKLTKLIRQN